ncbi:FkbM family methyltransferase [Halomonas sp. M5N1S17]|uniref:FkbM family methyltransferase n=1 Tax=Halomonas alkalisoli TaxID=2907158 RepID=UPI001F030299|nr:FkbM family methyltransferase [Halomonas alkalisoli]MCE9662512.1 FkbM family methyltransferase [Halomonas alkalisoli]
MIKRILKKLNAPGRARAAQNVASKPTTTNSPPKVVEKLSRGKVEIGPVTLNRTSLHTSATWDVSGWKFDEMSGSSQPRTIIDVGVATGTPSLYAAFPDAYLMLIEPVEGFGDSIKKILSERPGQWERAVATDFTGDCVFYERGDQKAISSRASHSEFPNHDKNKKESTCRSVRIDELVEESKLSPPFILKTDTEGFDFDVIKGAEAVLSKIDYIVAECRIEGKASGDATAIVEWLSSRGFRIYTINGIKWENDGRLRFADIVFQNRNIQTSNS